MPQRPFNSIASDLVRILLMALGGLCILSGIAALVEPFVKRAQGEFLVPGEFRAALTAFGWSVVAGVVLFAIAAIIRLLTLHLRQQQLAQTTAERIQSNLLLLEEAIRERPAANAPIVPLVEPTRPPAEETPLNHARVIDLLQQIRDLTMMDERQRREWGLRQWERQKDTLMKAIDREIDTGDWEAATAHVREVRALLPDDPLGAQLAERVSAEQARRLTQDLEAAHLQLRHLMSITAWTQAEEMVASLLHRYPHAPEVQTIADDLRRERSAAERESFQRLMLDLKDSTEHKQWRRAVLAAEELVRRFPDEPKVGKLKGDLPTLRENGDSQERREEEVLFKDLLHRQRYQEAYDVAQRVIVKFPTSSAALELAKLVPKVEELIRQEKLKRHQNAARTE